MYTMKKYIFRLSVISLIAFLGLNSCDQDAERKFYDQSNPPAYSFYQSAITTEMSAEDEGTYNVIVSRTNASEAASVPLTISVPKPYDDIFSLSPASAVFEKGEYETRISVKYDFEDIEPGITYNIKLSIPENSASLGSYREMTIKASMKMEEIGKGLYISAAFGGKTYEVSYRKAIGVDIYVMSGMFTNDVTFIIDKATGVCTIPDQGLGEDIFGADTETWISCVAGVYLDGKCTFGGGTWDNAFFTSPPPYSSGLPMTSEVFVLPEGY